MARATGARDVYFEGRARGRRRGCPDEGRELAPTPDVVDTPRTHPHILQIGFI